jgi:hypothetical protein
MMTTCVGVLYGVPFGPDKRPIDGITTHSGQWKRYPPHSIVDVRPWFLPRLVAFIRSIDRDFRISPDNAAVDHQ